MEAENNSPETQYSGKKPASSTVPGVILRILLVVIIGSVIGGAVYFSAAGWIPYLEQRVFQPIDAHQQEIQGLLSTQGILETQVADLSAALEGMRSDDYQDLQSTQAALEGSVTILQDSLDALRDSAGQNTYYSATLLPALLSTVSAQQESTDRNLSALATAQMARSLDSREAALLKVLALLSRANQFLLHDNFGLAEDVLLSANDYLLEISGGASGQDQLVTQLLDLVNGARDDLPAQPEVAAGKLELAWQLALLGLDDPVSGTVTPSASPGPSLTPTPN